jgi:hypothetical protein
MRRSLFSAPDSFSLLPLLALLPVAGKVGKLEALTSSVYARYENVVLMQRELQGTDEEEALKRFAAEEAMLRQVLDWLAVKPEAVEE